MDPLDICFGLASRIPNPLIFLLSGASKIGAYEVTQGLPRYYCCRPLFSRSVLRYR